MSILTTPQPTALALLSAAARALEMESFNATPGRRKTLLRIVSYLRALIPTLRQLGL